MAFRLADINGTQSAKQSQTEFLHTERKNLYAAFVSDLEVSTQVLTSDVEVSSLDYPVDMDGLTRLSTNMQPLLRKNSQNLETIKLLGSPDVAKKAEEVIQLSADMLANYQCGISAMDCQGSPVEVDFESILKQLDADGSKLRQATEEWIKLARGDLDLESAPTALGLKPS